MQYGRCSFEIPAGFAMLDAGSRVTGGFHGEKTVCITLISKYSNIACEPVLSENPKDLNIGAFPATLMLNTFISGEKPEPEAYALLRAKEMEKHLEQFKLVFCRPHRVREKKGVKAQFSFVTNFTMVQIQIIWPLKSELAVTTMITSPVHINDKWTLIEEFAESVIFGPG